MVLDYYEIVEIIVELLGDGGVIIEIIWYVDIVSFICFKVFVFDYWVEFKDVYDFCYCFEYYKGGMEVLCFVFEVVLVGKYVKIVKLVIDIFVWCFCDGDGFEGYQKDGLVVVVCFEGVEEWNFDNWILWQCDLSVVVQDVIDLFI